MRSTPRASGRTTGFVYFLADRHPCINPTCHGPHIPALTVSQRRAAGLEIFRPADNARRNTSSFALLKLLFGTDFAVRDDDLLKNIWHFFQLDCGHQRCGAC